MKNSKSFLSQYYSQHLLLTIVAVAAGLLFFSMLSPFLEAICLAAIFALGIFTLLEKLCLKFYKKPHTPSLPMLVSFYGMIFLFVGSLFAISLLKLYDNFLGENKDATRKTLQQVSDYGTTQLNSMKPYLNSWLKMFGIQEVSYESTLKSLPSAVFGASTQFISNIPNFVLQAIVFSVMMIFFFASYKALYRFALRIRPFSPEDINNLTRLLKQSSYESIMTNAIVGFLQASILTAGSLIVGYRELALFFSVTFIFSFIPVIGGSSVAFLIAATAFMTNNYFAAIGMIVIGCITGISDNILRSYLMSHSEKKSNPLLCFVVIIGAVYVFGFSGLFIGPFVIQMCVQLIPYVLPKGSPRRAKLENNQQKTSLA